MKQAKSKATRPQFGEAVLLLWLSKCESPYQRLSVTSIREISGYLPGLVMLPGAYSNLLRVFTVAEGRRTTVHIAELLYGSIFCMLDRVCALCLGHSVYHINLLDYEVTPWPDMLIVRHGCGVARHRRTVYVFGGSANTHLKSCERLQVSEKTWSQLPDMRNPRYCFMPSEYADELYLPNILLLASGDMEVFTVASLTFRSLPVSHPELSGAQISFVHEGELFIFTWQGMLGRWRLNSEETTFRVEYIRAERDYCAQSNGPPVKVGKDVYWVAFDREKLVRLNLDTLTITGG